jgi:4-hydroxybenzoate polyprenyltransferase
LIGISFVLVQGFWLAFVSYSLLLGWSYVLNQIFDVEGDRINDKLFFLPRSIISLRYAWIFAHAALIASVLMAIPLGTSYHILFGISLLLGYAYSGPPFRLKDRPFLDVLSNALGYGGLNLLVGISLTAPLSARFTLHVAVYVLAVAAVFLNTTIPDIKGDRQAGKRSTGVLLGRNRTLGLSSGLFLVVLVLSWIVRDPISLTAGGFGLLFTVLALHRPGDLFPKLAFRVPSAVFLLSVALRYPPLLVLLVLTLVSLRLYYKWRFGLLYPSMTGP